MWTAYFAPSIRRIFKISHKNTNGSHSTGNGAMSKISRIGLTVMVKMSIAIEIKIETLSFLFENVLYENINLCRKQKENEINKM